MLVPTVPAGMAGTTQLHKERRNKVPSLKDPWCEKEKIRCSHTDWITPEQVEETIVGVNGPSHLGLQSRASWLRGVCMILQRTNDNSSTAELFFFSGVFTKCSIVYSEEARVLEEVKPVTATLVENVMEGWGIENEGMGPEWPCLWKTYTQGADGCGWVPALPLSLAVPGHPDLRDSSASKRFPLPGKLVLRNDSPPPLPAPLQKPRGLLNTKPLSLPEITYLWVMNILVLSSWELDSRLCWTLFPWDTELFLGQKGSQPVSVEWLSDITDLSHPSNHQFSNSRF